MEIANIGLGKRVGMGGAGRGGIDWRTADLKTVCEFSPQVALARYYKTPFAPFIQSIVATFTNAQDNIGPFALGVNANDRLSVVSVVDQLIFQVDAPNYNLGNAAKGFLDWWWASQTGVEAKLIGDGSPRYLVAP